MDKSNSNKMIRVLVYEGDPGWVKTSILLRARTLHDYESGQLPFSNFPEAVFYDKGKITQTFVGTWQEFIKKMMGEER